MIKPHQFKYWLTNERAKDPASFDATVRQVCDLYAEAAVLRAHGTHVMATDEKTGMQATERKHPSLPMQPGLVERREFEYIRHGTQCLVANFCVATGHVIAPTIGPTRKEADFAAHIDETIETDPSAGWIFLVDQLKTHMSETLVRCIAARCSVEADLGEKGKTGILQSKKTRKQFLEQADHRIRFVYTWMAHLVVKPGGDLVFNPGASGAQARQFLVGGGVAGSYLGLYRLLQRDDGQAIQVDVQGATVGRLNPRKTSAAMI